MMQQAPMSNYMGYPPSYMPQGYPAYNPAYTNQIPMWQQSRMMYA